MEFKNLRKLQEKDAQLMYETMVDSEINQYMNISAKNTSIEKCQTFIKESLVDEKNIHFAIVDSNDNWVGTISLKNMDYSIFSAEYAIITAKKIHGTGISYAATKELLEYAFIELGLKRVYLNVLKENVRANKFYEKCGFKFEGCFRKSILIKGKIYDLNWYAIVL